MTARAGIEKGSFMVDIHDKLDSEEIRREEIQRLAEEVAEVIGPQPAFGPELTKILGNVLMGSPAKTVTLPFGRKKEVPWTEAEIHEAMDKREDEHEAAVRLDFKGEFSAGLEQQNKFFRKKKEGKVSQDVSSLILFLVDRVSKSKGHLTKRSKFDSETETIKEAQVLEHLRRLLLSPAYTYLTTPEDLARTDFLRNPFWESIDKRSRQIKSSMADPKDRSKYFTQAMAQARENPNFYTREEWLRILGEEQRILQIFLVKLAQRSVTQMEGDCRLYGSLSHDGELIVFDRVLAHLAARYDKARAILIRILNSDLQGTLRVIKEELGERATYKDLVEFYSPSQKPLKPETSKP